MVPIEIGYASSRKIADKMINIACSTDGFEENTFNSYQATVDYMEINNEPICFEEILEKPLSMKQMISMTTEENLYIQGNVLIDFTDLIGYGTEKFLNLLSEKLTDSPLLMDVNFKAIDVNEYGDLVLRVSGDVSNILELNEEMIEELKSELFNWGTDALEDFTDMDLSKYDDKDTIDNILDEVIAQMPEEDLVRFYRKYVK